MVLVYRHYDRFICGWWGGRGYCTVRESHMSVQPLAGKEGGEGRLTMLFLLRWCFCLEFFVLSFMLVSAQMFWVQIRFTTYYRMV